MGEIWYRILRFWYKIKDFPKIYLTWRGAKFYMLAFILLSAFLVYYFIIKKEDMNSFLGIGASVILLFIISFLVRLKIKDKETPNKKIKSGNSY